MRADPGSAHPADDLGFIANMANMANHAHMARIARIRIGCDRVAECPTRRFDAARVRQAPQFRQASGNES